MNPNLTVYYMAEQTSRGCLDGGAARTWLANELAATGSHATGHARLQAVLGAALVRVGERLQGSARLTGSPTDPAALPAR